MTPNVSARSEASRMNDWLEHLHVMQASLAATWSANAWELPS